MNVRVCLHLYIFHAPFFSYSFPPCLFVIFWFVCFYFILFILFLDACPFSYEREIERSVDLGGGWGRCGKS